MILQYINYLAHYIFYIYVNTWSWVLDRLCGLVVRAPGYRTKMHCFLWGTKWIYTCYVEKSRPPLWSSGHNSWLQIQRSGFDSRRYQIFWEVLSLERGPLSLASTIEGLLGRKSSGSGLENRYGRRGYAALTTRHPLSSLTSPTSGGRSVRIVRSRTEVKELAFFFSFFSISGKS
jgi:hypothetical protein